MVRLRKKNVPRPDRSDAVPARNSSSHCSGTITTELMNIHTGEEIIPKWSVLDGSDCMAKLINIHRSDKNSTTTAWVSS